MEMPVMRTRTSLACADVDLETATGKAYSHTEDKSKTPVEYLKKASRMWMALAALLIIVFFCLSSSTFNRSANTMQQPLLPSSSAENFVGTGSSDPLFAFHRPGVLGHSHSSLGAPHHSPGKHYFPQHHVAEDSAHQNVVGHEGGQSYGELLEGEQEAEDTHDYAEEEEEEELHADDYLAEIHPEYVHHDGLDDMKQHPDEPEYIDIWDGVSHEDLHLSDGIPGLKTPLFRLPFVDGQHNDTHVIGVHAKKVYLPRFLSVNGGKRLQSVSGTYKMYMIRDGRPKPHLNHGRLIWQKEGQMSSIFLYYDHMHHTWIFNEHLDLAHPQPMAFLAHGAILPIRKTNDHTFRKYGAPKSVHWIVRDAASGGSRPDGTIKVEADPKRSGDEHLQALLLQKVYHAPEDGTTESEGDIDDFELFNEEHEEEEQDEEEMAVDDHGEPVALPLGARSFQQFITHVKTNVYHTFDTLHARYDHKEILKDPVSFVETNPHPDMVGPERLDGYSHGVVPHPLRKSAHDADEH
ncbi:hypothetical protein, conserved [Eimeria necatrix]|uniref:Uncharacterized protein n=1 Tax=Eimeria necatrix TaxID=51315 RepID=U6MNH1_9EIME|nr:hypothetical protein, conserved [Eimeria necatrix]CDJ65782.1 hypothetical protein, conserved [Eimeria necatrix]